ncbi:hypothetical protein ACTQ1U_02425 [Thermoguttaceae bacterium LCP21S3_D4]|nr:hypothetical protein [Lachnospiraceae bacterium]
MDVNLRRLPAEIKNNIEILMCPCRFRFASAFDGQAGRVVKAAERQFIIRKNTFKNDNAFYQKLLSGHRLQIRAYIFLPSLTIWLHQLLTEAALRHILSLITE